MPLCKVFGFDITGNRLDMARGLERDQAESLATHNLESNNRLLAAYVVSDRMVWQGTFEDGRVWGVKFD